MNECECHLVIRGAPDRRQQLLEKCAGKDWREKSVALDFEKIMPSPRYIQSDRELLEDWRLKHWHVPATPGDWENYDASDSEEDPDVTRIVLCTADRPPLPVIDKLAELSPDLDFAFAYFEDGMDLAGHATWSGGKRVSERVADGTPKGIVALLDEVSPSLAEAARHVYGMSEER